MKFVEALFFLMFIALFIMVAVLLMLNTALRWRNEDLSRALDSCKEQVIICNQLNISELNREKQIEYQREQELLKELEEVNLPVIHEY